MICWEDEKSEGIGMGWGVVLSEVETSAWKLWKVFVGWLDCCGSEADEKYWIV